MVRAGLELGISRFQTQCPQHRVPRITIFTHRLYHAISVSFTILNDDATQLPLKLTGHLKIKVSPIESISNPNSMKWYKITFEKSHNPKRRSSWQMKPMAATRRTRLLHCAIFLPTCLASSLHKIFVSNVIFLVTAKNVAVPIKETVAEDIIHWASELFLQRSN